MQERHVRPSRFPSSVCKERARREHGWSHSIGEPLSSLQGSENESGGNKVKGKRVASCVV